MIPSSGDVELDALRRLAVNAPIAELVEHRLIFMYLSSSAYRTDPYLWQGMGRLADVVMTDPTVPNRRIAAIALAQVVENGDPGLRKLLGDRAPVLRDLAERLAAEQGKPSASTSVRIKL